MVETLPCSGVWWRSKYCSALAIHPIRSTPAKVGRRVGRPGRNRAAVAPLCDKGAAPRMDTPLEGSTCPLAEEEGQGEPEGGAVAVVGQQRRHDAGKRNAGCVAQGDRVQRRGLCGAGKSRVKSWGGGTVAGCAVRGRRRWWFCAGRLAVRGGDERAVVVSGGPGGGWRLGEGVHLWPAPGGGRDAGQTSWYELGGGKGRWMWSAVRRTEEERKGAGEKERERIRSGRPMSVLGACIPAMGARLGKDFDSINESSIVRFLQTLAVPIIGNACHVFMHGLNHIQIYGVEKLHCALLDRPQGKPLLTVHLVLLPPLLDSGFLIFIDFAAGTHRAACSVSATVCLVCLILSTAFLTQRFSSLATTWLAYPSEPVAALLAGLCFFTTLVFSSVVSSQLAPQPAMIVSQLTAPQPAAVFSRLTAPQLIVVFFPARCSSARHGLLSISRSVHHCTTPYSPSKGEEKSTSPRPLLEGGYDKLASTRPGLIGVRSERPAARPRPERSARAGESGVRPGSRPERPARAGESGLRPGLAPSGLRPGLAPSGLRPGLAPSGLLARARAACGRALAPGGLLAPARAACGQASPRAAFSCGRERPAAGLSPQAACSRGRERPAARPCPEQPARAGESGLRPGSRSGRPARADESGLRPGGKDGLASIPPRPLWVVLLPPGWNFPLCPPVWRFSIGSRRLAQALAREGETSKVFRVCEVTTFPKGRTPQKSILASVIFGFNSFGAVSVESDQHRKSRESVMAGDQGGSDDLGGLPNPGPFVGREEFMTSISGIMEMLRSIAPRAGSSAPTPQGPAPGDLNELPPRDLSEITPAGGEGSAPGRRPGKERMVEGVERDLPGRELFPSPARASPPGEQVARIEVARTPLRGSPFSELIISAPVPEGFRELDKAYYTGKDDPIQHLQWFEDAVSIMPMTDAFKCRLFAITLKEKARDWFHQLPPRSIFGFEDLSRSFQLLFSTSKKRKKGPESLFLIKQRAEESLAHYVDRFQEEVLDIQEMPGYALQMAFTVGLREGFFKMSLTRKAPLSFEELMERATEEIAMEAANPVFVKKLAKLTEVESKEQGGSRHQEGRRREE
ncbi:hypothetical protein KSP39_PZI006367 [Platanthera zijinensis]|uniref:Retrotransposon gag domain-containing protein n=1 Tax=Platanthera zijinensis TaxID=2320716 RepID=A0AAP0G9F6_9ASPA